jgi:hypothetical protein
MHRWSRRRVWLRRGMCGGPIVSGGGFDYLSRRGLLTIGVPRIQLQKGARNKTHAVCRSLARFAASTLRDLFAAIAH